MASLQCSGCGSVFTHGGYSRHLSQTRNPPCAALFQEQLRYIPQFSQSSPPMGDNAEHHSQFNGDFFGNDYTADDFPFGDDDHNTGDFEREPSTDEDDEDIEEQGNWEPPVESPRSPPVGDDDDDTVDDDHHPLPPSESRYNAEEYFRRPPHVVKFNDVYTNYRAGDVIHQSTRSLYQDYRDELHERNNIWAPFTSQIDWEIAQWAKLRGPGSTALTELLNIDGVRSHSLPTFGHFNSVSAGRRKARSFLQVGDRPQQNYRQQTTLPTQIHLPGDHCCWRGI